MGRRIISFIGNWKEDWENEDFAYDFNLTPTKHKYIILFDNVSDNVNGALISNII